MNIHNGMSFVVCIKDDHIFSKKKKKKKKNWLYCLLAFSFASSSLTEI